MINKKQTRKARGKRVLRIRVTTSGKPPISGALAFAHLLAKVSTTSQ